MRKIVVVTRGQAKVLSLFFSSPCESIAAQKKKFELQCGNAVRTCVWILAGRERRFRLGELPTNCFLALSASRTNCISDTGE